MTVDSLLEEVAAHPDCVVLPPRGLPHLRPGHRLPDDLRLFYTQCGGVELFRSSAYGVRVVTPTEFVPSNPIQLGEPAEELPCASWYVLAMGPGRSDVVAIDLDDARFGFIIDGYFDHYGVEGESPVIALSVGEFIERCLATNGDHWYWFQPGFVPHRDAIAQRVAE